MSVLEVLIEFFFKLEDRISDLKASRYPSKKLERQRRCFVVESLSHFQLFCGPMNCGQAPLSMGFSRQEYWSGLPFPSPENLPHPGVKPESLALAGGYFTIEPSLKL